MKYIRLVIFLFFLCVVSGSLLSGIRIYTKLNLENIKIEKKLDSCRFISKSFKNTCEGKGFKSLTEWQKICKSMWNLKYISWCEGNDFMPEEEIKNRKIFYGRWIGNDLDGEVYWEKLN